MNKLLKVMTIVILAVFASYAASGYEDLAKLVKAGTSDDVIIAYINNSKENFALTADNIQQLKAMGASDKVITTAIQHQSPATNSNTTTNSEPVYVYGTVPPTGEWVFIDDYWYWEYPSGFIINLGWQPIHFYNYHEFHGRGNSFGHGNFGGHPGHGGRR